MAALHLALSAGCPARVTPARLTLTDLDGGQVRPLAHLEASAVVFLFARTDCPISNRYAPEVSRLFDKFAGRGVKFWLVYPDPDEAIGSIRVHMEEYGYAFGALLDPGHELVKLTGARVTPEAAVYARGKSGARLVYRGRIDDRFVDFGKARPTPTVRDLEETLEAILQGRPVAYREARAVGCFIPELP
jgi:peroxiredoxin